MKISSIAALLLIGTTAMVAGTEGISNTYYGLDAGNVNNVEGNSFFGRSAGYSNNGYSNTFIGIKSGYSNTIGFDNTFNGFASGYANTTGNFNTFSGFGSGYNNITGYNNTFSGYESGRQNSTGNFNTFSGNRSGYSNTEGSYNTFVGHFSGRYNQTGNLNVFLGNEAGYYETGSNRLYIDSSGTNTPLIYGEFDNDLVRVNGTFETVWSGSNTEGDGLTNLLVLSANNSEADLESDAGFALRNEREGTQWNFRTHQNGNAFVATIAGTGGPEFTVKNATGDFKNVELYLGNGAKNVGGLWINASSRTLKENIKDLSTQDALAAFHKLQPVTYNYKTNKTESYVGFIAEDVPELVAINSRDGLSSMDMVAVLTKVVQEQEKNNEVLRQRIGEQEQQLTATKTELQAKDAEMKAMKKRLSKVESILTNLSLDTSDTKKEKVSVNLK